MDVHRHEALDELEKEAGKDPLRDRFLVGYLSAVSDLNNVEIEEVPVD